MTYSANSDESIVEKFVTRSSLKFDPWLTAVLACFTLLAWASWGKLVHLIFDTGNEVEITASLLTGQLLYRDLQTFYGPLAYYINALPLLLFGQHLEVFYATGLALALAATLLVYQLAKQLTNRPWAFLCTVCVLIYCAFRPGGWTNFITPYSYGAVYAVVLCLVAFTALNRYSHTGRAGWLVAAAIACGFAGLAKQEYGVASLLGILVGANLCSPKNFQARLARSVLIILVASVALILPLALLAQQVSWNEIYSSLLPTSRFRAFTESGLFDFSLGKTLSDWRYTFTVSVKSSLVVGLSIVAASWLSRLEWIASSRGHKVLVTLLASITFAWVGLVLLQQTSVFSLFKIVAVASLVVLAAVLVARSLLRPEWIPNSKYLRTPVKGIAGIALIGLILLSLLRFCYCSDMVFHPLGYMTWLLIPLVGWFALRWRQLIQHRHAPLLWTLLIFSVLLNARFWFSINLNFYGMYALTAVLLLFTLLYHIALETGLPVVRFLLVCLLIGGSVNLIELGQYRYAVHSSHGTAYIKEANLALAFNQTISYINSSGATSVQVTPVGAMLNFLTATHSPSQEKIFLPGALPNAEAEREFLDRMRDNPPELIVYVDVPFWWLKQGYQTYAEFNPLVDQWIVDQHKLVYVSPQLVYGPKEWTIRIYTRKQ